MADIRLPAGLPTAATPTPARTTDAVRAAQRAFFNAALSNAGANAGGPAPSAPAARSTAVAAPAATPLRPLAANGASGQSAPARPLRPGALVDIRV